MGLLEGKVAAITGGARGIGLAIAKRFVAEGAQVVIADIEEEALHTAVQQLRRQEHDVLGVVVDVATAAAVERLLQDSALRARLASAARQRALEEFDQRQVAAASIAAYARAAHRKRLGWSSDEAT